MGRRDDAVARRRRPSCSASRSSSCRSSSWTGRSESRVRPGSRSGGCPPTSPTSPGSWRWRPSRSAARGTAIGEAGAGERDAPRRHRGRATTTRCADASRTDSRSSTSPRTTSGPIASGAHQPVADVTEVVGVATLPAARRRGLGAAVTAALVEDATAAGLATIFLSAASDDVARIYERLGFRRAALAGLANRGDPHGLSAPAGPAEAVAAAVRPLRPRVRGRYPTPRRPSAPPRSGRTGHRRRVRSGARRGSTGPGSGRGHAGIGPPGRRSPTGRRRRPGRWSAPGMAARSSR